MDTSKLLETLVKVSASVDCLAGIMLLSDGSGFIEVDGEIAAEFNGLGDLETALIQVLVEYVDDDHLGEE